jgi:Putative, 10TM heavy-metal exporter
MITTVLTSVADAFMSIGVIVMILAAAGVWVRLRCGSRISSVLARHQNWGPLAGALVTMPPGCLGVLGVARLYNQSRVTYGTLLASFFATMGDSAWLLLATHRQLTLYLKLLLLALGAASGYIVDIAGVHPGRRVVTTVPRRLQLAGAPADGGPQSPTLREEHERLGARSGPSVTSRTDETQRTIVLGPDVGSGGTPPTVAMLWFVGCLAATIALPVAFQLVGPEAIATALGDVDVYTIVGVAGFALAVSVVCQSNFRQRCGECGTAPDATVRSALNVGAREAAHVTVWSGVAFASWDVISQIGWADMSTLPLWGATGVVLVAVLGLIPACGVEVAVAGFFVAGGLPLPALAAYLISEDGSAFIPLAVARPRAAVVTNLLTTAVAMAIGLLTLVVV